MPWRRLSGRRRPLRIPTSLRGNRYAPAQAGVSSTNAEVRNCSGNSLPTAPEPFPAWGCEPMFALSIRSAAVCPSQGKGGSRSRRPSEKYWNRRPAGPSMQGGQVHSSSKAVLRAKITDSSPPKRATKLPGAARRKFAGRLRIDRIPSKTREKRVPMSSPLPKSPTH